MPAYTLSPVNTANFTAADGTNPETLHTWMDSFPNSSGGYYVVRGNRMELDFGQPGDQGLADLTGTYANRQYVIGRLQALTTQPSTARWLGGYLHGQGANATADYYRLQISQDSSTTPLTTKFFRVDNAGTPTELASTTAVTWADGDRFLFVAYDGVLELYRDTGSGFGTTSLLTYTDPSALTGGVPGVHINGQDSLALDDVEVGTAIVVAGGPVLSSPTVVSSGNTIATVRVTTDTAPTVSSILAVRTRAAAAPAWTAAEVLAAPTQTITSGASGARDFNLTGLVNGTPLAADFAQTGPSNLVSTASFTPSTVPGAPTIGTAVAGNAQATVNGTAPASNGGAAITGYRSTATPGGSTVTGASLPITHTGLSNGTAYTFTIAAENLRGFGAESAASNSVTPALLSVTLDALVDESGAARAGYAVDKVFAIRISDNTLVATKTNQTTNGSGVLPAFSDAALTAAPHVFVTWDDNETPNNAGAKVYTPS